MQGGAEYCMGIKFSGAVQSFDGYTVYKMNANMGMEEQILAEGCRKGIMRPVVSCMTAMQAVCWPSASVIRATVLPPKT